MVDIISRLIRFVCREYKRFMKYVLTGLTGVVIDFGLLFILTEYFDIYYIISAVISYMMGFLYCFFLNKYWVFKKKGDGNRQLIKYSITAAFNYLFTILVLYLLTDMLGLYYMISKFIIIATISTWNFLLYKYVIYK